jgi:hypothetical protein
MNERWTVEIVCTDRGQHKRTWMTRWIWESSDGWRSFILMSDLKHDMYGPAMLDEEPGSVASRESYGFCCSRCPRWPKIKWDRWLEIMEASRDAKLDEFDVSYLD